MTDNTEGREASEALSGPVRGDGSYPCGDGSEAGRTAFRGGSGDVMRCPWCFRPLPTDVGHECNLGDLPDVVTDAYVEQSLRVRATNERLRAAGRAAHSGQSVAIDPAALRSPSVALYLLMHNEPSGQSATSEGDKHMNEPEATEGQA